METKQYAVIAGLLALIVIGQLATVATIVVTQGEQNAKVPDQGAETNEQATQTSFALPPDGVRYFTLEVGPERCFGDTNQLYSPYQAEWYVNTGENGVGMAYDAVMEGGGDKEFVTNGEWWPLAVTSYPFDFCFFTEDGETVTIALALLPPQKG
ncbi:MAG: hypothetical protein HYS87_03670 [Candidatus Colwellbacteria bacterium]|nr:hypothetical protein [Candidatus Colwellbacteria bacterium]